MKLLKEDWDKSSVNLFAVRIGSAKSKSELIELTGDKRYARFVELKLNNIILGSSPTYPVRATSAGRGARYWGDCVIIGGGARVYVSIQMFKPVLFCCK